MKRISFHIEDKLLEWIDEHRKVTRSEFIRKAVEREYQRIREVHREYEILERKRK